MLRHNFERRLVIRTISAAALLALCLGVRWHDANRIESRPPARDVAGEGSPVSGPNASHFYAAAADALTGGSSDGGDLLPTAGLAPQRVAVAANGEALGLLRLGFRYRYQGSATRWTRPSSMSGEPGYTRAFPNLIAQRHLARLLAADASVKDAAGDPAGAIQSCLDLIRFGQDVGGSDEGALIGAMIGQSFVGMALETALDPHRSMLSGLSASDARAAARRLEALLDEAPTAAEALQSEKDFGFAALHDVLPKIGTAAAPDDLYDEFSAPRLAFIVLRYGKQGLLDRYTGYMSDAVSRAALPYPQYRAMESLPIPDDPICRLMAPNTERAVLTFAERARSSRILLAELALQAYRREHGGEPPATLAALTGGPAPYLTRVPLDPFSPDNAPLPYREGRIVSADPGTV